jgi:hypothetical protein
MSRKSVTSLHPYTSFTIAKVSDINGKKNMAPYSFQIWNRVSSFEESYTQFLCVIWRHERKAAHANGGLAKRTKYSIREVHKMWRAPYIFLISVQAKLKSLGMHTIWRKFLLWHGVILTLLNDAYLVPCPPQNLVTFNLSEYIQVWNSAWGISVTTSCFSCKC